MKGIDWRVSPLPGPTPVQSCVLRVLAVDVLSCGAVVRDYCCPGLF